MSTADSEIVLAILTLIDACSTPLGMFIFKFTSPKTLIGIGNALGVVAFLVAPMVNNLTQYILCFSVMYGMGIGLCQIVPLACGW